MLRLLVALDFSDCSREALRAALSVAAKATPAELVCVTVLDPLDEDAAQTADALNELEGAISKLHEMVNAEQAVRGKGGDVRVRIHYTAVRGQPAEQIISQARSHHVDAIVIGTHGRTGLDRLLTGSVAEKVVRQAPCSVLTIKPKKTA